MQDSQLAFSRNRTLAAELPSPQMSSVFLVVKPIKMIFLMENATPQKEDLILLYDAKVCKIMAFTAMMMGLGLLFLILFGFR